MGMIEKSTLIKQREAFEDWKDNQKETKWKQCRALGIVIMSRLRRSFDYSDLVPFRIVKDWEELEELQGRAINPTASEIKRIEKVERLELEHVLKYYSRYFADYDFDTFGNKDWTGVQIPEDEEIMMREAYKIFQKHYLENTAEYE